MATLLSNTARVIELPPLGEETRGRTLEAITSPGGHGGSEGGRRRSGMTRKVDPWPRRRTRVPTPGPR